MSEFVKLNLDFAIDYNPKRLGKNNLISNINWHI